MNRDTLIKGIVILIIGIIFWFVIGPVLAIAAGASLSGGLLVIAAIFAWIGIILVPVGIIVIIVGAVTEPKVQYVYNPYQYPNPPPQQQYYPPPGHHYPQHHAQQPNYPPPAQQQANTQTKFCTNCGYKAETNARFCNNCGQQL